MKTVKNILIGVLAILAVGGCAEDSVDPAATRVSYDITPIPARQFEWDTDTGPGWIKILIEEASLGSRGVEVAEIFFPPGFKGATHPHELEVLYVVEGELDHIVNGESHILKPGMVGIVREPDLVVHRTNSVEGVRAIVIWPLGKEVDGFKASGMREVTL